MKTLRARPALMILLVLLSLILLTGVVYAVGRSLGYVPGVGLVDQEHGIRILSTPVSAGSDQITFTIKQVVADATHTFISYQVDGISTQDNISSACTDSPALQLADGRKLDFLSGGAGGMESIAGEPMVYETSYTFPPLPAGVKTVSFLPPCDRSAITLQLVLAPADFVEPVVEVGATYAASGPSLTSTPAPTATSAPAAAGSESTPETAVSLLSEMLPRDPNVATGLSLEKVIELDDDYVLIGNFTDGGAVPGHVAGTYADLRYLLQITDAQGQVLDFWPRPDLLPENTSQYVIGWAYEFHKSVAHGPLKLSLASVPYHRTDQYKFSLDVGQNPQPDQKWELDRAVKFGEYQIDIDDITALTDGYAIHYHTADGMPEEGLMLQFDLVSFDQARSTAGDAIRNGKVIYGMSLHFDDGTHPAGNLTFSLLGSQHLQFSGPWTLTWSPPSGK
jgi:hypothetical protein